jgi:hypothetical protein
MAYGAFKGPDSLDNLGTVVEGQQLGPKPLGQTFKYDRRVEARGRLPDSRQLGGVIYAPYLEALDIIRQVDDELSQEAEARGESRDKGFFLEQLQDLVAEEIDTWLLDNNIIRESDGAVTIVKARNALQTALDVYHGVDAFLDIEIRGLYKAVVTIDITLNPEKLRGDKKAKADLVLAPIKLPESRRRPRDPAELAHWREERAAAKVEIRVIAHRILRGLRAERGLNRLLQNQRLQRRSA